MPNRFVSIIVKHPVLYKTLCEQENKRPVSHLKFRRALLVQLVGEVRATDKKKGRPSTKDKVERLDGKPHFIEKQEGWKHKDCSVCSNRKEKGGWKVTVYFCATCSRNPGLHPGECFRKYHTLQNFK